MALPALAIAGIASAAASAFGSMSAASSASSNNAATNEANFRLAKAQNQWNIDQWNRENEYNSPKAQMERLREAGLNPNLAYNNVTTGNASALTSANLANQRADTTSPQFIANALNAVTDIAFKINQSKLTQAQIDKVKTDTVATAAQTEATLQGIEKQNRLMESQVSAQELANLKFQQDIESGRINNKYLARILESNLRVAASQINSNDANAALNDLRRDNLANGLPADGGTLYERLISNFFKGITDGSIKSPANASNFIGKILADMFK